MAASSCAFAVFLVASPVARAGGSGTTSTGGTSMSTASGDDCSYDNCSHDPSATILVPEAGATVTSPFEVQTEATDNCWCGTCGCGADVLVAQHLRLDGGEVGVCEDYACTFEVETTPGMHTLRLQPEYELGFALIEPSATIMIQVAPSPGTSAGDTSAGDTSAGGTTAGGTTAGGTTAGGTTVGAATVGATTVGLTTSTSDTGATSSDGAASSDDDSGCRLGREGAGAWLAALWVLGWWRRRQRDG